MDPMPVNRGLSDILSKSLVATGSEGVMLNHVERGVRPKTLSVLMRLA